MKQLRALVVDDDPNIVSFFTFTLDLVGYQVEKAYDGKAAYEKLGQFRPDLIVLDMKLPDTFGKDILTFIRADERLRNVFVILATAEPQTVDPQTDKMANFVLSKPVDHDQLRLLAERIFHARR